MMTRSDYLRQVEELRAGDALRERIAQLPQKRRRPSQKRVWIPVCACLAVAVVGVGAWIGLNGGMGANAGGSGHDEASTFMSYAGPVLPLTLKEENNAITASRDITLDFEPWVKVWWSNEDEAASRTDLTEAERQSVLKDYNEWYPEGGRWRSSSDIRVTDSYTLTNATDTDQTVTLLYPFVSSLDKLDATMPTLTADGVELSTTLHAGKYTGGFEGAWNGTIGGDPNEGSVNLDDPESWEAYQILLSDGTYQKDALEGYPDLSGTPVIVYKFTDPWGEPEDDDAGIPNPSIRATFNLDYSQTTVLSYGFHSGRFDRENDFMGQGFSIRQPGERGYGEQACYLIVLGEDITNLTTQGYVTGGFDPEDTIESGVTVTRYEADLDDILREMFGLMWQENVASENWPVGSDYDMYYGLFCEHLVSYGVLSESTMERYGTGWLTENDFNNVDRVFYLEAEVTIPAGGSVQVAAAMTKEGSYDFYCAHTENQGVYGYDMTTLLGSNLSCTEQTAKLLDHGQIEIVRQNFGFDPTNGITRVTLDPAVEHYYLEVVRAVQPENTDGITPD